MEILRRKELKLDVTKPILRDMLQLKTFNIFEIKIWNDLVRPYY